MIFGKYSLIHFSYVLCHAKSLQPCPTLCDPIDGSLPGSSVHGILQARLLKRAAKFEGIFPTQRSVLADRFLTTNATGEAHNS